jgi:hypothetical protein
MAEHHGRGKKKVEEARESQTSGGDDAAKGDSQDRGSRILSKMAEEHTRHKESIKSLWESYRKEMLAKKDLELATVKKEATSRSESSQRRKTRKARRPKEIKVTLEPIREEDVGDQTEGVPHNSSGAVEEVEGAEEESSSNSSSSTSRNDSDSKED